MDKLNTLSLGIGNSSKVGIICWYSSHIIYFIRHFLPLWGAPISARQLRLGRIKVVDYIFTCPRLAVAPTSTLE